MLQEPCSSESTSWFPCSSAAGVPSKAHFIVILRFWGKWLNKYLNIKTGVSECQNLWGRHTGRVVAGALVTSLAVLGNTHCDSKFCRKCWRGREVLGYKVMKCRAAEFCLSW